MSADSLVELFKGIGLSEAKAKDTVKNGNLSKNLEEAINFTQNAKISQVSQLCFFEQFIYYLVSRILESTNLTYTDFSLPMFVSNLISSYTRIYKEQFIVSYS